MSLPLKDIKLGIPWETHAVLDAYADANGEHLYDVIRGVLCIWAHDQLKKHTLMHEQLKSKSVIKE